MILERLAEDPARFLGEHWERSPALHRAGDRFEDLFSVDGVDRCLRSGGLRVPDVRFVRDGEELDARSFTGTAFQGDMNIEGLIDARLAMQRFAEGATMVFQGLQRYWAPAQAFCTALSAELGHRVQANAYFTPPRSRGLALHFDPHSVFAVQLAGRKRWNVSEPIERLPRRRWSRVRHAGRADTPELLDLVLEPGDVLYVPRGFLHRVATLDEPSLHVTVGIRPLITWADLARETLDELLDHEAFRGSLPPGLDRDALVSGARERLAVAAEWLAGVEAEALADRGMGLLRDALPEGDDGRLEAILASWRPELPRRVRRVRDFELAQRNGAVELRAGDRSIAMPARAAPLLERLRDEPAVAPAEIPGSQLDAESVATVVRRLMREGVVAGAG